VVAAVAGDDEAAHQRPGPALQQGVAEAVDGHARFDHRRLRVHDVGDGSLGVEGMAERTRDFQQEAVALDQADRTLAVDDGYDEGVGLALEAGKHVAAQRLRRHRLGALGENFDCRHTHRHSTATGGHLQGTVCGSVKVKHRRFRAVFAPTPALV
jgi:hypothetical protein